MDDNRRSVVVTCMCGGKLSTHYYMDDSVDRLTHDWNNQHREWKVSSQAHFKAGAHNWLEGVHANQNKDKDGNASVFS